MTEAGSIGEALADAEARLRRSGSDTPRLDAELLVAHAIGTSRTAVLAHPEVAVPPSAVERLGTYVARRERGEPVAYIRGMKEFHGLAFAVDRRALIPRPDTELLVELAVSRAVEALASAPRPAGTPPLRVADVGTGSGAVAVAVAAALRRRGFLVDVSILATDLSADALGLAIENAVAHGLADSIRFAETDLFPADEDAVDLLLANLPYVRSGDVPRLPVAASFEPPVALDGGADGLAVVRRLLERLPAIVCSGGRALLEIGAGERAELEEAASAMLPGWSFAAHADLAGIERVAELARAGAQA